MAKFKIKKHSEIDKSFIIDGPLQLEVDFDDVNHQDVDAMADVIVKILNDNWNNPVYKHLLKQKRREYKFARWNKDTDLREEYPNFEDYLKQYKY